MMLAGCVSEPVITDAPGEGIVLDLVLENLDTKTTRDGDASLNENLVANTIDIFFYDETTLEVTKEVLGAIRVGTRVQIPTNPSEIEDIFGTLAAGAHCGVFVVANFSGSYAGTAGSRTITQIKNSLLPAPTWETLPQASFVMTGEQQVELGNAQGSTPVYAQIGLARVAAKVTFDVTVATSTSEDSNTSWTPDTESMSVYMVYAMRKATLGAEPVDMPATASATYSVGGVSQTIVYSQYEDKILYNTNTTKQRPRGETTVDAPVYSTTYQGNARPFYTYPLAWETGSSMEPYMKLIIPWQSGNTTRKYYYKIPFHGNALERNHWYHISIDVQILGTEQADPPKVDIHYAIADWSGEMDPSDPEEITSITSIPAQVIMSRYLSIPTTEYVLFNENQLIIPIQSSHDVEVLGFTVASGAYTTDHDIDANYVGSDPRIYNPFTTTTSSNIIAVHPDYSSATPSASSHSFTYDQAADAQGWSVIVDGRKSITFNHPLQNDPSSGNYDVAPYTIRMRVRHQGEGATLYFTDIIIEQRPAIIIKPERNSDMGEILSTISGTRGENHTAEDGYVFDNGTRTNTSQNSNRRNVNFNMYVIETSVLPTTGVMASYVLGDPRSLTPTTISGTANGEAIDTGSTRTLANYYEAGENYEYDSFIAPKFRIASSFGASAPLTRANAKLRCAAYQEDGYPAGRWRLPTVAEIVYMARLTTDNLIPRLLGSTEANTTTDYWCNSGFATVTNGENVTTPPSSSHTYNDSDTKNVRCVYDEWYWEDTTYEKADKEVYKWGDQLRSAVRKKN